MKGHLVISMEEKSEEKKYTTISIPTQLAEKIKKRIQGTGFTSLSSYVTYVLREVLSGLDTEGSEEFSKEDEERVKARLRSLGYLD
jgi:Arc/MetJ-type ribon-helix-helix transcriptional regulator